MEVSTVGSMKELNTSDTNSRSYTRGGNGPRTEGIHKRQVFSEQEKFGVSLEVSIEFSLPIQLGITEDKQVKDKHQRQDAYGRHPPVWMEVQGILGRIIPIARYSSNSSEFEFRIVLNPKATIEGSDTEVTSWESLDGYIYSCTSQGLTVNSRATRVLVIGRTLLLSRCLTQTK